jgi:hypothetical protein
MNDLVREIEDDIRRERFDRLWQRFGRIMVGISVCVVLATIAVVVMQNQKKTHAMEQTSEYIRGIDRMNVEDYKGAITIFDRFAEDTNTPYYGLAMLQKAKAQEALGNNKAAGETYQKLAARKDAFGSLAALLAPTETGQLIDPDKASPFYYTEQEWKAWQLFGKGQTKEAVDIFMVLREDLDAPMSLRARMNDVVQHVAPERLRVKDAKTGAATEGQTNEQ